MDNKIQKYEVIMLLNRIAVPLAAFLEKALPQLFGSDWWNKAVKDPLSKKYPLHKKHIRQKKITTLSALDLSALLQVLEIHWDIISKHSDLPKEHISFVKEMQAARHR